jgi:hypothetical protein
VKRVPIAVASDPPLVSVIASAPIPPAAIRPSRRCFCSGDPKSTIGETAWKVVAHVTPVEAQPALSSWTSSR